MVNSKKKICLQIINFRNTLQQHTQHHPNGVDLLSANKKPLKMPNGTTLKMGYMKPSYLTTNQFMLILPLSTVPYNHYTVKVAFFAINVSKSTKNVDKIPYDTTSLQRHQSRLIRRIIVLL